MAECNQPNNSAFEVQPLNRDFCIVKTVNAGNALCLCRLDAEGVHSADLILSILTCPRMSTFIAKP